MRRCTQFGRSWGNGRAPRFLRLSVAVGAVALLLAGVGGTSGFAAEESLLPEPLRVSLVPEGTQDLVPGLVARNLAVVVRTVPADRASKDPPGQAWVIRGVEWRGGQRDGRRWRTPLPGAAHETPEGRVVLNPQAGRMTALAFEQGLLLPGETMTLVVPLVPQDEAPVHLVVRYAEAGEAGRWARQILLPEPRSDGTLEFFPATPQRVALRRARGGLGYLRPSSPSGSVPEAEHRMTVEIALPFPATTNHQATGGISLVEAARRSGVDGQREQWHGVYCEALLSWFFVREDGLAVALRRIPVSAPPLPPKAPPGFEPKPWRWERRELPAMDRHAADHFGEGRDGATLIRGWPEESVAPSLTPPPTIRREAGTTGVEVTPGQFWELMDQAVKRSLRLRLEWTAATDLEAGPVLKWDSSGAR